MGVHPSTAERVNHNSQKSEQPFQKGRTAVHPTLFNESIYDLSYQLPAEERAQSAPSGFDDFWRAYPKKVARGDAVRAFAGAVRYAPEAEIIRGAMHHATERHGEDPRFTKHPATWLIKTCWRDQSSTPRELARDGPTRNSRFDGSIMARMHTDEDFDEVSPRIQQQCKRGKKWTP